MWPFERKISLRNTGLLVGSIDHHSHILSGVDDGVQTIDKSFEILDAMQEEGIKKVWFTPHIMEDFPNGIEQLKDKFEEFKSLYRGEVIIDLASENMMDTILEKRLLDSELLPIGVNKTHLLIETSYLQPPINFYEIVDKVKSTGLHPLFAHVERYLYLDNKDYEKLRDKGMYMQLNISSLFGYYGRRPQKNAFYLLEHGFYDCVGTDTHKIDNFRFPLDRKISSKDYSKLGKLLQTEI